jgi:UDP-2,4-diacetamido-2,4,6-trideoxy-beta-L-altropyranose hydrolase
MTDGRTLLVRCDASVAIGTGHAMRCLALSQAWQDAGGSAVFAMAEATLAIEERLRRENVEVTRLKAEPGSADDVQETVALARGKQASWVVVDGYGFGANYQSGLKHAGLKVLFIDDNGHAEHYSSNLVLNQNAYASDELYRSRDQSTKLLLGGSNPRAASLEELTGGENSIQVVTDATDMPEQMSWADLAVTGAGSTCLEMCFMGLPALLIDLAENQTPIAIELARRGTARHLGGSKSVTPDMVAAETRRVLASEAERRTMSQRGRQLVDGAGAERVVRELLIS